ncbi:hypothetical protein BDV23DRAFT_153069 [Aspergillus alliaceus]|uniref:EF-hand domain-containing protein n=1 Tax=Petromyces alliaceus TaxID=209559 RepID=A0A5N7CBB8_PETAA|nr:hypothetical protein BDV23DRAFT_153069 [Aspergillus alliaceus]
MNAEEYRIMAREVFGDRPSDEEIQSSFQKQNTDHGDQLSFEKYMDSCVNLE